MDAFRLAVRQHAIFDDRRKCCRQPEQSAMPTGPNTPEPDTPELDMPEPDARARCPSKSAEAKCLRTAASSMPSALKHRKIQVRITLYDAIHTPMPRLIWHTIHDQFYHRPCRTSKALDTLYSKQTLRRPLHWLKGNRSLRESWKEEEDRDRTHFRAGYGWMQSMLSKRILSRQSRPPKPSILKTKPQHTRCWLNSKNSLLLPTTLESSILQISTTN
jgi:hypothetical protein